MRSRFVLLAALTALPGVQFVTPRGAVVFPNGPTVRVEIAATETVRQRGLMFRSSLGERDGMLFVFDQPGSYPFWMQNCLIPLDILWIDASSRIVSISANVPPCRKPGCDPPCAANDCPTYAPTPGTRAKYVLEVAAGFTARHKIGVGQTLKIQR
jgi:uncharacterized membrane protein (UPF0127 family)